MTVFKSIKSVALILALVALSVAQSLPSLAQDSSKKLSYPESKRVEHTDDYFGTKVADPYRWLENLDSDETKAWVEAQNKVTFGYLNEIPVREQIKQRLTKLWNFEKFGIPFKEGGRYFYSRNSGLQNQSVLYTAESLTAEPRVLLDPNTLSSDGTVALTSYAITDDGKLMA